MKRILRVFPRRTSMTPTDRLAVIGEPGLFVPKDIAEVHVSCTFTWDMRESERLADAWSKYYPTLLGGPAFDSPAGEFEPGMYLKRGITITSRGCSRSCPWCYVPAREGGIKTLLIRPGNIVQDNNLLACPRTHVEDVFRMLRDQKQIVFLGGLDARLFSMWHIEWLDRLSVRELWFACDTQSGLHHLEAVAELLRCTEFRRWQKRCYVLMGFAGETTEQAESRLQAVWDLGFMPFAQFYRGPGETEKTRDWADLQRVWSRPAIMFAIQKARA